MRKIQSKFFKLAVGKAVVLFLLIFPPHIEVLAKTQNKVSGKTAKKVSKKSAKKTSKLSKEPKNEPKKETLPQMPEKSTETLLEELNQTPAATVPVKTEAPITEGEEPTDSFEQRFIDSNIYVSEWFDGVSEGLDLFLTGQSYSSRPNETKVVVSNTSFYNEVEKFYNSTSLNVNLRLPNLEEYWQLKFASYDEKQERSIERATVRRNRREKNYGATIGLFKKLGNVRTAFQPRIGFQDPLDVSHYLTFESVADFKAYEINPKLEFYANAKKGTGMVQALNFNFHLSKVFTLTWVNEGDYEEKLNLYSVTNGLSLGQLLTQNTSLAYGLFFGSNNRPSYHLESYTLAIAWNHVLYKKILDYQLTPHLDFVKVRDFAGLPGITFNLNLNF